MCIDYYFFSVQKTMNLEVGLVVQGVKMIYVPIMPGHKKRVSHT